MSKFMKLSRAEMKDVLGGLVNPGNPGGPVGEPGGGDGGAKKGYQCCKDGLCSECFAYDKKPHCPREGDVLTECSNY